MKPFTLKAVLKYRKQLEDVAATELAKARIHRQEVFSQLTLIQTEYNQLVVELEKSQAFGIAVNELSRYEDRIFWLKTELTDMELKLAGADTEVQRQREKVIIKRRDKKILEQLRDKQNAAYNKYLDKKETAQLDEIAVLAYEHKD